MISMLNETEIRNWHSNEKERLSQTIDPIEHKCRSTAISTLEGVLND